MVEKGIGLGTGMAARVDENKVMTLVEPPAKVEGGPRAEGEKALSKNSALVRVAPAVVVVVYLVALAAAELGIGSDTLRMVFLMVFSLGVVAAIVYCERGDLR